MDQKILIWIKILIFKNRIQKVNFLGKQIFIIFCKLNKLANICQLPKLKDSINKTEFELDYLCVCSLDSKFDKLSNDVNKFEE